jgi:Flp pilus assembly protein TadG
MIPFAGRNLRTIRATMDAIGNHRWRRFGFRKFWEDRRGVSGIEFGLVGGSLCLLLLNGVDVARYFYSRMQVENAAQMGAQAAWKSCDPAKLPAKTQCSGLTNAVTAAVQSTSLGSKVSLRSGSPSEGYYCLDKFNALQPVGSLSARPVDCSATAMPHLVPGDYIKVDVTYSYTPLFLDLTLARLFETPVTKTAYMRLL